MVFPRFDSTPNFDERVLFRKIFQQGFLNPVTAYHFQVLEAGQILWYSCQETATQPLVTNELETAQGLASSDKVREIPHIAAYQQTQQF